MEEMTASEVTTAMNAGHDTAAVYRTRRADFERQRDELETRSRAIARARATTFLLGAGLVGWVVVGSPPSAPAVLGLGVALLAVFAVLVVWHARVDDGRAWAEAQRAINDQALARIDRRWDRLPDDHAGQELTPSAEDLDLFGHASLMQLLGPSTSWGRDTLARWLLDDAAPAAIRARQQEVADLAGRLDFRQALAGRALLAHGASRAGLEPLVAWAEDEPWLTGRSWLVWVTRLLSGSTLTLIGLQALGWIAISVWVLPAVLNLVLIGFYQIRVHHLLDRAASAADALRHYASLFELIANASFEAEPIRALQAALRTGRAPAHVQLRRLDRINDFSNFRRSAAIFHFPIHTVTLWDFHVLDRLERWQEAVGPHVRDWFGALAEVDALSCLAALRDDNPDWCFPELQDDGTPAVRATRLGHPLLPASSRIVNDVEVGPPGSFLLVTGSNMSGKSTLLRAIGLNVLLGKAGGAVCAADMSLPPVSVETSMRIHDSLEEGVSYFMAALTRLRAVVDAVRVAEREGRMVLYLLDEILQGTNTAERQTATRAIVASLMAHGAIGAITTHDLGLVDSPALAAASRPVHFSEAIHEDPDAPGEVRMTFDYQLRPGLATSRNALALMKMIGLAVDGA